MPVSVQPSCSRNSGNYRSHVIAGRRDRNLGDSVRKCLGGKGSGTLRNLRKCRVFLDGHAEKSEVRRTTGDRDSGLLGTEDNGRIRKPAGDLGQQASGDENPTRFFDLGGNFSLGGNFVVKGRECQHAIGSLQQHATQDRQGGALRQQLHSKGHCLTEDVSVDLKFHGCTPYAPDESYDRLILARLGAAPIKGCFLG